MKRLVITLFCVFTLSSCENVVDNIMTNDTHDNYTSPYQGTWEGKYSGDETGNLILEVSKKGTIKIIKTSEFGTENFISGFIRDDSALQQVKSSESGFTLQGNLIQKKGTWEMKSWKGDWSVTKK